MTVYKILGFKSQVCYIPYSGNVWLRESLWQIWRVICDSPNLNQILMKANSIHSPNFVTAIHQTLTPPNFPATTDMPTFKN